MGRWTQYDEDDYRLPEGFKRVAYDADTGKYTYQDTRGHEWDGAPHERYGVMRPTGTTRVYQPAATTTTTKHRTSSFISLDGPWTSITKEMAESGLSPEELSSNPMYPRRRSSGFVQSAKKLAKRIRSLSVSAGGDVSDDDDGDGYYNEKHRSSGNTTERGRKGLVDTPATPQSSHSTLKRSFSTTAASSQKAPPMTRRSSMSKESTTTTGTAAERPFTLRPSKTMSYPQGSNPTGSRSGRPRPPPAASAAISRTLAYALESSPPLVPPKDPKERSSSSSSSHRRVVSDSHISPRTQPSQSHHSKSGSGSGPTVPSTTDKPSRRWKNHEERERERIEKERDKQRGTGMTSRKDSREQGASSSSRALNPSHGDGHGDGHRSTTTTTTTTTADKTPIYSRFSSSQNRDVSSSRHQRGDSVKV